MRVYCETYGCTMNKGDSEIICGIATKCGHEVVEKLDEADMVIINTCVVKGATYRKMLRRIEELKKTGKDVLVAGCLPLVDGEAMRKLGFGGQTISCRELWKFYEIFGNGNVAINRSAEKVEYPKLRQGKVSAIVPIAEGCNSHCTYCSVKFARGDLRSFSQEKICQEVKEAVKEGYKEILLTAQDTAAYGLDCGGSLPELLGKLVEIDGNFRIRVGMMNPKNVVDIAEDLLDVFSEEKIYKFLHIPVQSGSDEILKKMGRDYTANQFLDIVERFYRKFPDLYLCTDVIVGFPGEGEEDFRKTCELIEKIKPDKTNISKFSPMPKTAASKFKQVDGREIAGRSRVLSDLCRKI
ncbi:MAG: tRNA (N(6)-L-threonylcarbamoyladenosine(37)-C(2))-methylthiotransferase, partial [Candidatus Hadarchaeales archaeon]